MKNFNRYTRNLKEKQIIETGKLKGLSRLFFLAPPAILCYPIF